MKNFILLLFFISLCSCQRSCQAFDRSVQFSSRSYHIEQYSGGQLIKTYDFKGILNNSSQSDGYYFSQGDTLIEISGDISIKSW